jgi:hypothetical protein
MATIWYLKEGVRQVGPSAAEKSLDWFVRNLDLRIDNWIAGLETKNLTVGDKSNPELAPYRGFRYAVIEVSDADLQNRNDWKTGFYLLKKDATQVRKILDAK